MDHSNDAGRFDNPQSIDASMPEAFDTLVEVFDGGSAGYFDFDDPLSIAADFPWSLGNLESTGKHLGDYDRLSPDEGNSSSTATETDCSSNHSWCLPMAKPLVRADSI